jgi:hypothetical protein
MHWTTHIVLPKKLRDPNCTMSVRKNTSPSHPPPLSPLPPLDANTHVGIHLASASSNLSGELNGAHCSIVASSSLPVVVNALCNNSHINSNKYFFSSFNNADPSHILLVDCWMLCCRECGPITAVWRLWPPWLIYSIAFYPIYIAFLCRHTQHNSAKPKSNHKPTTYLTKYLRQYLADEDISSHNPLRMYGGQMPVLYGCTYLLLWGWRFMVKQLNTKKTNILR